MANKKKRIPKVDLYPNGGEFGNALKNYGLAGLDTTLSTFGATNVVKDSDYSGKSAEGFAKAGNIMGGITKAALPIVGGVVGGSLGGPMGAKAGMGIAQGVQGVGSQFNPQDPNAQNSQQTQQYPQQQQGMNPNQMMQMANTGMQIYNMGSQMGAFRNGGMQYCADGGMINAEVEKQENTLNPDGSTNQYNGPSHEGGGIKTHLDPKTMVFSDRLKMNGKTFAKLNKPNNTDKEDSILEDTNANSIQKLTAELMKTAKNRNSQSLFEQQESLKQSKMDKYAKRIGLSVDGKYPDGGMTPQQWNQQYKAKGWQVDPRQNMATGKGQYPAYYDPNTVNITADPNNNTGYNVTGLLPDNSNYASYQKPVTTSSFETQSTPQWIPMGTTQVAGQNAGYFRKGQDTDPNARYIYQGGQYTKMPYGGEYDEPGAVTSDEYGNQILSNDVYNSSDNRVISRDMSDVDRTRSGMDGGDRMGSMSNNPNSNSGAGNSVPWGNIAKQIGLGVAQNAGNIYDLKRAQNVETTKFARMTPSQLDPTAALNYNMVQGRKLNEDIRNSSGGNASNYIQNRKDASINQMMSNAQIRQNYANQNAGIMNQASMFNTGIANQEEVANEQNRAQSRNLKANAYSNIGQNIMGQYKDVQMGNRDQDMLNIIQQQYPEAKYNPALKNYYNKRSSFTA